MASREMQLVSRIIYTGELSKSVEWGITVEDFLTQEGRAMFNHILGYYSQAGTSGSVIGPQAVAQMYPSFMRCDDAGMTTEALCLEVRKGRLSLELQNRLDPIRELAQTDPMAATDMMHSTASYLTNVGYGKNTDTTLGVAYNDIMIKQSLKKQGVDLSCGPWPWQVMNDVTGGFQPDDYIILYGRPKSFKTWVLSFLISWVFNQSKRAVVYTKEMTAENIFMRVIACMTQIDYHGFRFGTLSPEEEEALHAMKSYIDVLQASQNLICLSGKDAPAGGDTVPWLTSKVEKYKPDYIFVDGMYLMSDIHKAKQNNQKVANISRDLRQMVLSVGKPLICTVQANRAAAKNEDANLDEIAFSDSLAQDATGIIRVINEKDKPTCQMVLGGAREYSLNGFRINAVPAYDFSYHGPLTSKEIENAKKEDAKEEDNPQAHGQKRKTESMAAKQVVRRLQNL